jgi:hypothetical protein
MRALVVFGLFLAACSRPTDATGPQDPELPALRFDFGVIPHGETRQHDFPLDLAKVAPGWIPLRVHLDCSCGRGDLRLIDRDGNERVLDGRPVVTNLPGPGETLVARVLLETVTREPADLPKTTSRGSVLLQAASETGGLRRLQWPLLLDFGVDAPVVVRPFTALDFGRVPVSQTREILLTMRGDDGHPGLRFGEARSTDPSIDCVVETAGDEVVLRSVCRPVGLGNQRAIVSVATNLPDYSVNFAATWKAVPDLEATPMAKVAFRTDMQRAQTEDEAATQFVVVTDHDLGRPPEFVVREIVDDAGRDAAAAFAVTIEPVPGQTRQQRLRVRYLGGYPSGFRGSLMLGKPGTEDRLPIELVAFPVRDS